MFSTRTHGAALSGADFSVSKALRLVLRWSQVARQRRALARLSDETLRDIGLTRADADIEAARPFWDLPTR